MADSQPPSAFPAVGIARCVLCGRLGARHPIAEVFIPPMAFPRGSTRACALPCVSRRERARGVVDRPESAREFAASSSRVVAACSSVSSRVVAACSSASSSSVAASSAPPEPSERRARNVCHVYSFSPHETVLFQGVGWDSIFLFSRFF